jgi:hypothetical protein
MCGLMVRRLLRRWSAQMCRLAPRMAYWAYRSWTARASSPARRSWRSQAA